MPLRDGELLPEKSERGTLLLDSDIVADVWVDGQNSGFISPTMFRLPAGEHTVQLRDADERGRRRRACASRSAAPRSWSLKGTRG